ncbi:putative phosphatase [Salsuginibacillus halophilus]|uniref:Putative phosphatase n=1 Tax=Salsuginibacillus halophilus TaxID=517424 RepID=A0A2P8HBU5_9BACI|nr:histidine phosphatase family protein [Salsuginibacillus halophilus]PSL43601.1 putative phosphatase [Salsuginibacillus halophilus]
MNLLLIRHGESEGNRTERLQGIQDFPLSEEGKKQAALLGQALKTEPLDHMYASDLSRAFETAQFVAEHQLCDPITRPDCREVALGPLEGRTREEIIREYPGVLGPNLLTSGLEGTETIEAITKRCRTLYDDLITKHEGENIAVVAHGGFIAIFLMYLMHGEDWSNHHRPFRKTNTGVTRIEFKEGKPYFHYVNKTTHLEAYSKS